MLQPISKLQLVSRVLHESKPLRIMAHPLGVDDVKDIYRRAEGHELVVEGLREGTTLVSDE